MAYDGENLRLADRITGRLYTLPRSGDYYLPYPSFDFSKMCADDSQICFYDSYDEMMNVQDYSNQLVNSFSISLYWGGDFYFDGEYYWSAENFDGKLKRINKFDSNGNLVAYYQSDETIDFISSLIIDGNDIWCITIPTAESYFLTHLQVVNED